MQGTKIIGDNDPQLVSLLGKQPVSSVTWRKVETLKPNGYNPNHVAPPEMELLILSIMEDGFTQPIVVLPDLSIVDGFHRWQVASDPRLLTRYRGFVPTVTIAADPVHQQMSTIRHNRARGVHGVVPMADIVASMRAAGVTVEDMKRGLGMDNEEVARLADRAGMPERMRTRGATLFGKEWKPSRDA